MMSIFEDISKISVPKPIKDIPSERLSFYEDEPEMEKENYIPTDIGLVLDFISDDDDELIKLDDKLDDNLDEILVENESSKIPTQNIESNQLNSFSESEILSEIDVSDCINQHTKSVLNNEDIDCLEVFEFQEIY